jgi:hypothetical protein
MAFFGVFFEAFVEYEKNNGVSVFPQLRDNNKTLKLMKTKKEEDFVGDVARTATYKNKVFRPVNFAWQNNRKPHPNHKS